MPTYEDSSIAEHEAQPPACPNCAGRNLARAYSAVYVKTSKKS